MSDAEPPSLEDVRARIDAVDAELLRLIDERAGLAHEVAKAKRAAGGPPSFALRPARESQVLRRLLDMPRAAADRGLVVRMWREIIGDSLARQGAFHIAAWGGRDNQRISELARLRFGVAPYLRLVERPEEALATARELGGVGVLALGPDTAWWGRLLAEPKLSVFAVLPCLSAWGPPQAMAVAEVEIEPSGPQDETLWVTDATEKAWEIELAMSRDGVAAKILSEARGLKLFALSGFYQKTDERLARAPGRLTGVIGAAPAAFDV